MSESTGNPRTKPVVRPNPDDPKEQRAARIYRVFHGLGFNLVPGRSGGKSPEGGGWGWGASGSMAHSPGHAYPYELFRAGCDRARENFPDDKLALFWLCSGQFDGQCPPIGIVDVDDLAYLDRVIETFGRPRLTIKTGRDGGGVHLPFRVSRTKKMGSKVSIYGRRTVDFKAWGGGVIAAGNVHRSGRVYRLHLDDKPIELEDLTAAMLNDETIVPAFDYALLEHIYMLPENRQGRQTAANASRKRAGTYVRAEPRGACSGDYVWTSPIPGDIVVRTPEHLNVEIQEHRGKCFADAIRQLDDDDATDANPSGQVWVMRSGLLVFTDHSEGSIARVMIGDELERFRADERRRAELRRANVKPTEAALFAKEIADDFDDDEAVTVELLEPDGFLDLESFDGVTILRAPTGTGKTEFAVAEMDSAERGLAVANSVLLVGDIARRFGIPAYDELEWSDIPPKAATTINSLLRFAPKSENNRPIWLRQRPERFLLVDEADQVLAMLYSRIVSPATAIGAFRCLFDLAATWRSLFASADIDTDVARLIIREIRRRSKTKPIRVAVKEVRPKRRKIAFCESRRVQAELYRAARDGRKRYFCTESTTLPRQIAVAYQPDEVEKKTYEPEPWHYVLDPETPKFSASTTFSVSKAPQVWISSLNSRHELTSPDGDSESLRRFFEGNKHVNVSPSLTSGVDIQEPFDWLGGIFHGGLTAEGIFQALGRVRNLRGEGPVFAAVPSACRGRFRSPEPNEIERDLALLWIAWTKKFDSEAMEFPSGGFLEGWVACQRRQILTSNGPLGRAIELAERHGYEIVDCEKDDNEKAYAAAHSNLIDSAKLRIRAWRTDAFVAASPMDEKEAKTFDAAYRHKGNDPIRREKRAILNIYGVEEVTDEILPARGDDRAGITAIDFDAEGKGRKIVFRYARAYLYATKPKEFRPLFEKREPENASHATFSALRSALMAELFLHVFGVPFGAQDEVRVNRSAIVEALDTFPHKVAALFEHLQGREGAHLAGARRVLTHPRIGLYRPDESSKRQRWLAGRLRDWGASVRFTGKARTTMAVDFWGIGEISSHYLERLENERRDHADRASFLDFLARFQRRKVL